MTDFCRESNPCLDAMADRSSVSGPSLFRRTCHCCRRKARIHNVRSGYLAAGIEGVRSEAFRRFLHNVRSGYLAAGMGGGAPAWSARARGAGTGGTDWRICARCMEVAGR